MFKGQKGITLVALVITIIVLLILAGVSISLVVGQNGVLTRAQNAVTAQKEAEVKQAISLAINSCDASWGEKWATNSSYTRKAEYIASMKTELASQGYDLGTTTVKADGSAETWTLKANNETYTVSLKLDGATGKVEFTSVAIN